MFKPYLPTVLLTTLLTTPALASQTGTINFYGYVYDDTAIQDKEELLNQYIPTLQSGQSQKAALLWEEARQNERLVIKQEHLDNKMVIEISYR